MELTLKKHSSKFDKFKSMKYKIDNLANYEESSGWICGQLVKKEILNNQDVEINFRTFLPGHTASKHSHPKSKMVLIILSGKIKMKFEDEERLLEKHDFAFLEEGVPEEVVEVFEPTEVLCARTPSVENNKIELS